VSQPPSMNKTLVLLMMTIVIAGSTAGCIGEKYLDRLTGEDLDNDKERKCSKKCLKECMDTEEYTEEECERRCIEQEDSNQEVVDESTETRDSSDQSDEETRTDDSSDQSDEETRTDDSESEEKCYNEDREEIPCE